MQWKYRVLLCECNLAVGATVMPDCHLRKGLFWQPHHKVKRGCWEKRVEIRENIPLKIGVMVSSWGSGNTVMHQKKNPLQPWSARCICYHGTQPRQPLSCLSRLGEKEREREREREIHSVFIEADVRASVCVCVCVLHVCIPSTHPSGLSFKMLYTDRGSSHNMNHLVTRAELEMSRLISVPHATAVLHHLHFWQCR